MFEIGKRLEILRILTMDSKKILNAYILYRFFTSHFQTRHNLIELGLPARA